MDIAEQISAFEEKRAALVAANQAIMERAAEEGSTLDQQQSEEFDENEADVAEIGKHLKRLKTLEVANVAKATTVVGEDAKSAGKSRGGERVEAKPKEKLDKGLEFARLAQVRAVSNLDFTPPTDVAKRMFGENSNVFGAIQKATVDAGTTASGNWAEALVDGEGGGFADFVEYLRPATIIGRFGTGSIPSLRSIPHNRRIVEQTGGGSGYWVGEAKPKPLTAFDFNGSKLDILKVANIAVLSEEIIRDSSPAATVLVRDGLRDALAERLDTDFVDPAKAAVANVSPASITNGADAIAATSFTDADDVRLDIRSLIARFTASNNSVSGSVLIMSENNAVALTLMTNALGQPEFPTMTMMGGSLMGVPVITSEYVGTNVIMVKASDIYLVDNGGVSVDMSREASLEMNDAPTQDAPTGASLVSMFQNNLVALRAERQINWARRRDSSVAYLTGVAWGGAVTAPS